MRSLLILCGVFVVAISIGGALFFFGPSSLQSDVQDSLRASQNSNATVPFNILAKGTNAISVLDKTNYRITSSADLATLWAMIYGERDTPKVPNIDFSKYEVLAIFDGSHTTGVYGINVVSIVDATPTRSITITHTTPNPSCSQGNGASSPFELIEVPATTFSLTHVDNVSTSTCSTQ